MIYLQTDGVDDHLSLEFSDYDEVEIDIEIDPLLYPNSSSSALWYMQGFMVLLKPNNTQFSVSNSGLSILSDTTAIGVRGVIRWSTGKVSIASSTFCQSQYGGYINLKAKFHYIKLYKAGVLVAYYDMSTGTVIDQSGNGNDATLTGGTWIEDGSGEVGSSIFDSLSIIYEDSNISFDNVQEQYEDRSINVDFINQFYQTMSQQYDSRQSIYESVSDIFDTRVNRYSDDSTDFDIVSLIYDNSSQIFNTVQKFYEDNSQIFDLLQELFDNGQMGFKEFDLTIQRYVDDSTKFDNNQLIYEVDSENFDTLEELYDDGYIIVNTKQKSYEDSFINNVLQNIIYEDGQAIFDIHQSIYNADKRIIGTIHLRSKRILNVQLQGKRDLIITLQGGVNMTSVNQNFEMYSGDTKIVDFVIENEELDLTGSTVIWTWTRGKTEINKNGILDSNNDFSIALDPIDTKELKGRYNHKLKLTDNQGSVSTISVGCVTII